MGNNEIFLIVLVAIIGSLSWYDLYRRNNAPAPKFKYGEKVRINNDFYQCFGVVESYYFESMYNQNVYNVKLDNKTISVKEKEMVDTRC